MAEWRSAAKGRELFEKVEAILAEYEVCLPLTLRQIFYRLVGPTATLRRKPLTNGSASFKLSASFRAYRIRGYPG
jgi:hypothetical protein